MRNYSIHWLKHGVVPSSRLFDWPVRKKEWAMFSLLSLWLPDLYALGSVQVLLEGVPSPQSHAPRIPSPSLEATIYGCSGTTASRSLPVLPRRDLPPSHPDQVRESVGRRGGLDRVSELQRGSPPRMSSSLLEGVKRVLRPSSEDLFECRRCGKTLDRDADECSECGCEEVVRYEF